MILNFLFCGAVSIRDFISSAKSSWNQELSGLWRYKQRKSQKWKSISEYLHKTKIFLESLRVRVQEQSRLAHDHNACVFKSIDCELRQEWTKNEATRWICEFCLGNVNNSWSHTYFDGSIIARGVHTPIPSLVSQWRLCCYQIDLFLRRILIVCMNWPTRFALYA